MTVFVGGSISIQHLGREVKSKLTELMNCNINILVGDANGVDRLVQEYLKENWYWKVWIYAGNGRARNNVGNWNIRSVEVSDGVYGREYYTQKDIAMTKDCNYGFMIWDGKSQGTLKNVERLIDYDKPCTVYIPHLHRMCHVSSYSELKKLIETCK